MKVVVKLFEVSLEMIGVEICGVLLVFILCLFDGFGVMVLEVIFVGVLVLIGLLSGFVKCIEEEFGECFLKFVCVMEGILDIIEDWVEVIDVLFRDCEEVFSLVVFFWEEWNFKFIWEFMVNKFLMDFSKFGDFYVSLLLFI